MGTLYLCGAGNSEGVRLAATVNRVAARWDRLVLLDDDSGKHGRFLLDVPVLGPLGLLQDADPARDAVVNLVARTTARRLAMRARIAEHGIPFASLVHPGVDLAWVDPGPDVLVYEQVVLSPEIALGPGSVVFMRAVVGHEAQVGAGCVLAAGSVLNARVRLGEGVYVGTNASILPEVTVGDGATIGANTMVMMDVPAGATVVGVPGQVVTGSAEVAPQRSLAEIEDAIAAAWTAVLGRDMGRTFAFGDVGGTSLQALRILEHLRTCFGLEVAVPTFYRFPTVRTLAQALAHVEGSGPSPATARGALRRAHFSRTGDG